MDDGLACLGDVDLLNGLSGHLLLIRVADRGHQPEKRSVEIKERRIENVNQMVATPYWVLLRTKKRVSSRLRARDTERTHSRGYRTWCSALLIRILEYLKKLPENIDK